MKKSFACETLAANAVASATYSQSRECASIAERFLFNRNLQSNFLLNKKNVPKDFGTFFKHQPGNNFKRLRQSCFQHWDSQKAQASYPSF